MRPKDRSDSSFDFGNVDAHHRKPFHIYFPFHVLYYRSTDAWRMNQTNSAVMEGLVAGIQALSRAAPIVFN